MDSIMYTRDMLQALTTTAATETKERAIQKRVEAIVAHITQQVLQVAEQGRTHYLLDGNAPGKEHLHPLLHVRPTHEDRSFRRYEVNVLPEVMVQLKRLFPDCDILSNPLQTYVLVDWS